MLLFTFLKHRDAEVSENLSKSAPKPEKTREISDHVSFSLSGPTLSFLNNKMKERYVKIIHIIYCKNCAHLKYPDDCHSSK